MSVSMRQPEIGDTVLWFPHGDRHQTSQPAIVLATGSSSIAVGIFSPTLHNLMLRDGCRHIDDARSKSTELMEAGSWDFTPAAKRLAELELAVVELANRKTK